MIFRKPGAALNPVLTVGLRIAGTAMVRLGLGTLEVELS
jgi:hypothetical protein